MKINKETTTPKQQEQQQEQLQEHQQQSPATNGIKQPPFSDTSASRPKLKPSSSRKLKSSNSRKQKASKGRGLRRQPVEASRLKLQPDPKRVLSRRHHGPHPPFAHPP